MFPNQFDEAEKIINAPFIENIGIERRVADCKGRLRKLERHDPVVAQIAKHVKYFRYHAHRLNDEDLYVLMAFELVRWKQTYEKLARDTMAARPAPMIILKGKVEYAG